jgi:hypothetical protein
VKKLIVIPVLLSAALGLTACGVSTGSTKLLLANAPAELLRSCKLPVKLPERGLTQADIEKLWGSDRASLVKCYKKHKKTIDYYLARDAKLRGEG